MNNERKLLIASRRYLIGEISIEELQDVEKPFSNAFNDALYILEKRKMRTKRWNVLHVIKRWIICLNGTA